MKNITLSADEKLIAAARAKAQQEHTTLNAEFRRWMTAYVSRHDRADNYIRLMDELANVSTNGAKFSREQMNER